MFGDLGADGRMRSGGGGGRTLRHSAAEPWTRCPRTGVDTVTQFPGVIVLFARAIPRGLAWALLLMLSESPGRRLRHSRWAREA